MKKNIVFAIRSLDIGGAERLVLSLAQNIDKTLFDITIITMYDGVLDEKVPSDVRHIKARKTGKFGYFGFLLNLRNALQDIRPDIIYTHLGEMNLCSLLLKPLLSFETKVVWCFHSAYLDYESMGMLSKIIFRAQKLLSHLPSRTVCVSGEVKRYHAELGFCEQNMTVIDNGIDTAQFIPSSSARSVVRNFLEMKDTFLVGMSARLDKIKGYEVFAKAAKILLDEGLNVRFLQIGGGDENIKKECIRILGVHEKKFTWLGATTEPHAIYPAFDIAVSASLGEAFSLSIAEAMSCGVPVVASDVGVFSSLVGDGGLIVPSGDAQALATGIKALLNSDYADIGKKARWHIIQNYSIQKTTHLTGELFKELLE